VGKQQKSFQLKLLFQQLLLCAFVMASPSLLVAEENAVFPEAFTEAEPLFLNLPTYIYEDYIVAYERTFSEEAIPYWWAVGLSTAVLIATDDKWISESQRLGDRLGVSRKDNTNTVAEYQGVTLLRLPTDLGSLMYFVGDGWTHVSIAAGFLATGALMEDDKAYGVGFQIIEGMITTTIATQTLKHITGRQTPSRATTTRTGKWDFFPNQKDYFKQVPNYDAFPSGHLAVASMTLTVISKNYPDKAWIMPTGITLLSLLSFQMMNNEVHWASDYPLAIALGYTFGTIAYERGQKSMADSSSSDLVQWVPIISGNEVGLGLNYQF